MNSQQIDNLTRCIEIQIALNEERLEELPSFREGARIRARNSVTSVDDMIA